MNEEKQNKQYYQETFREVHAPQALAERIGNMSEVKNKKRPGMIAKGLAAAAAAAVILFAGGNGIAYATTGSSLFELLRPELKAKIVLEDDCVYIVDGDIKIDVTKELQENGRASGTYEKDGKTKEYCVVNPDGQLILTLDLQYYSETEGDNGLLLVQEVFGLAGTPTPAPEK